MYINHKKNKDEAKRWRNNFGLQAGINISQLHKIKKKLFLVYTVFQLYEIINIHHPINFIEVNHTLLWWKCPWSADKDRLVSILLEDSGSEGSNLHPIPMSWQ